MFVGSLVRFKGHLGIITSQKTFPSGLVRNRVEWCSDDIVKNLWWDAEDLDVLGTDEINILRGSC